MKTIIYTSYPCVVKYRDINEHISINEHVILDDILDPIYIYPEKRDRFSFEINFSTPAPYYRIIEKDGKRLVFLLDGFSAENVVVHDFKSYGITSKIEIGQKEITFYGVNHKKIINLFHPVSNITVGHFYHINYVKFDKNDKKNIICYNIKTNSAKMFSARDIVIDKNGFSLFEENEDYKNITRKYFIDKDGLKLREQDFSRNEEMSPNELLPYKFMSAVKCGDFSGAMDYLSSNLKSSLNEKTLKGFFGDVSYFYMIDPCSCFAISNNKNIIYNFSIENDKISEIQDNLN